MFKHRNLVGLASAALGISFASPNVVAPTPGIGGAEVYEDRRRSKGKQAKRRKRPNRLTISKRVRRKHRRAAR